MVIVGDEKRSQVGFVPLRNRYRRRAQYLLDDKQFLDSIATARSTWNEDYPGFAIQTDYETEGEPGSGVLFPERLWEAISIARPPFDYGLSWASSMWLALTKSIALEFWPESDFPNPYSWPFREGLPHPAQRFVSARVCGLSDFDSNIESYFPGFRVHIEYLSTLHAGIAEVAERDFYLQELRTLLKNNPAELKRIENAAKSAGSAAWRHRSKDNQPYRWPYVPIVPGMSSTDLKSAAGMIAKEARDKYEELSVDHRIIILLNSDEPHANIAKQLGVSIRTVGNLARRLKRKKRV